MTDYKQLCITVPVETLEKLRTWMNVNPSGDKNVSKYVSTLIDEQTPSVEID